MNLLYASFMLEDTRASGIINKVVSQTSVFSKTFDNVYLYISRHSEAVLYRVSEKSLSEIETFKYKEIATFDKNSRIRRVRSYLWYNSFLKYLNKIVHSHKIDIVYFRFSLPSSKLLKIMRNKKLVRILEIPTYPYENEVKKLKGKIEYIFFWRYMASRLFSLMDNIVVISGTNDIKEDSKFTLISNGIHLENIKVKKHCQKDHFVLLSVANVAFWHGYDRVLRGMHDYYKNNPKREVYYNCVGDGPELENLKKLARELKLEKYVIFHGTKVGDELEEIVDTSDVAIGSLGFHRIELKGGSPLKSREYCARGIPFVIAYDDQDFPKSFPYVFKIPSDESPVDINKVVEWYEKLIYSHPEYSIDMRKYAEEHLSWDAKMKPVIEVIEQIALQKKKIRSLD